MSLLPLSEVPAGAMTPVQQAKLLTALERLAQLFGLPEGSTLAQLHDAAARARSSALILADLREHELAGHRRGDCPVSRSIRMYLDLPQDGRIEPVMSEVRRLSDLRTAFGKLVEAMTMHDLQVTMFAHERAPEDERWEARFHRTGPGGEPLWRGVGPAPDEALASLVRAAASTPAPGWDRLFARMTALPSPTAERLSEVPGAKPAAEDRDPGSRPLLVVCGAPRQYAVDWGRRHGIERNRLKFVQDAADVRGQRGGHVVFLLGWDERPYREVAQIMDALRYMRAKQVPEDDPVALAPWRVTYRPEGPPPTHLAEHAPNACPDGGTCNHGCPVHPATARLRFPQGKPCYRVLHAAPVEGRFVGDEWPQAMLEQHQDRAPEREEPE